MDNVIGLIMLKKKSKSWVFKSAMTGEEKVVAEFVIPMSPCSRRLAPVMAYAFSMKGEPLNDLDVAMISQAAHIAHHLSVFDDDVSIRMLIETVDRIAEGMACSMSSANKDFEDQLGGR